MILTSAVEQKDIRRAHTLNFIYFTQRLWLFFRAELAEAKKRAKTYKERKKHDRFDGMPEEEVSKRVLPDHLTNNLDIIIVSWLFLLFSMLDFNQASMFWIHNYTPNTRV